MSAFIEYEERFVDEDPARRGRSMRFRCRLAVRGAPAGHRATGLEGTGELRAASRRTHLVLGTLASFELAEAVINGRPEGEWRIEWLRATVAGAPTSACEIVTVIGEYVRRRDADFRHHQQQRRDSFEVVELSELPDPGAPYRGDHYTGATWPRIAEVAIEILEDGLDPLDTDAVAKRAEERLNGDDALWLLTLFANPITISREHPAVIDSGHRSGTCDAQASSDA
ncbi:MAG: hypothetical protein WKF96_22030 [Solirubrobacteraceae bacterium]